ncbi:MAG: hypothetical protein ACI4OT_01710 [Bacilli bacterium]
MNNENSNKDILEVVNNSESTSASNKGIEILGFDEKENTVGTSNNDVDNSMNSASNNYGDDIIRLSNEIKEILNKPREVSSLSAEDIVRENEVPASSKTTQELIDEVTGVSRNNPNPIEREYSPLYGLNNENVEMDNDTREAIEEFENEGFAPSEIMDALSDKEKEDYQTMIDDRNKRRAEDIVREREVPASSKTTQELIDEVTGVSRNNPNPIEREYSPLYGLNNENVEMDNDTREAIEEFENEGFAPSEIMDALSDKEKEDYQTMIDDRNKRRAEDIVREREVPASSKTTQELIDEITGVSRNNPNPVDLENGPLANLNNSNFIDPLLNDDSIVEQLTNPTNPDSNNGGSNDGGSTEGTDGNDNPNQNGDEIRDFNLSFDGMDKIEIQTVNGNEDLLKDLDAIEKEIRKREEISQNPYRDLSDDQLDDMYEELDKKIKDEFIYSSQYQNGMEENDNNSLVDQMRFLKEEILRRKENGKYGDVSTEELQKQYDELDKKVKDEFIYSSQYQNGMEENDVSDIVNELNQIKSELDKRKENKFAGMSYDELIQKRDELLDEYNFVAHQENGLEGNVNNNTNGRKVFINDIQTQQNISMDNSGFKDGVYYNLQEIIDALNKELDNIAPNEVVVCKKTGEVVSRADFIDTVVKAAFEYDLVHVDDAERKIDYNSYMLKLRPEHSKDKLDKGEVTTIQKDENGNEIPLAPNGPYVRGEDIKKILNDYGIKGKTPNIDLDDLNTMVARMDADMLDKFWGNKEKAQKYKETIDQYKSHIITREDGTQYVEDFEDKAEIEQFLQLEDFGPRLEAYSRLQVNNDNSLYLERIEYFREIGMDLPKGENGQELSDDEIVKIFAEDDAQYISTYNNSYNRLMTTYYNLQTLGKYGEKMPYYKMEHAKEDDGFGVRLTYAAKNVGHTMMNIVLFGKNHISAPIHKFVGTYVVAPVYKLITKADERTAGQYGNKRSHRYQAALEYYQQQYLKDWYNKRQENGKPFKQFGGLASSLKMLTVARFKALTASEEAYKRILEAGHMSNVIYATQELERKKKEKEYLEKITTEKETYLNRQRELETQLQSVQSEEEKTTISNELASIKAKLEKMDKVSNSKQKFTQKSNQTDAINLDQHNKSNKQNVTHVVTAVETASKIAMGVVAKKALYKIVQERKVTKTPDTVGYKTETTMDQNALENLTLNDGKNATVDDNLMYTAYDNQPVQYVTGKGLDGDVTGIVTPRMGSHRYSGSTVVSNTNIPHSSVTLAQTPSADATIWDTMSGVLQSRGIDKSSQDLIGIITNSQDPQAAFVDFFNNTAIEIGEKGWVYLDGQKLLEQVMVTTKVPYTIPGTEIATYVPKKVLDPKALAGLTAVAASGLDNVINEVRSTRGEEEMIEEGLRKGPAENERIKNKPTAQEINPEGQVEVGFTGKRDGDYEAWERKYGSQPVENEQSRGRGR